MRTDPLSTCERDFLIRSFKGGLRQDERSLNDFRKATLVLGSERGSALCTIGKTKVLCNVSASITKPTKSRPQKGIISVEVDLSPMASPSNESGRLGSKGLELTRLLELVLRDSRCVDVESLCIRAHEEVWKIRVDVRVLDEDGCLVDCASVAAAAALQHFARPDVSVFPQHTVVHTEWNKPLVPLNIYHMPVCVSFGFCKDAGVILVDPDGRESMCVDGCMIVACNRRREICVLHQTNNLILTSDKMLECIHRAMERTTDISDLVSAVVSEESKKKSRGEALTGFETNVTADVLTTREAFPNELLAPSVEVTDKETMETTPPVREENVLHEEHKDITRQVNEIAHSVDECSIQKEQKHTTSRQQDIDDLNELLDDLEGEEMQLGAGR